MMETNHMERHGQIRMNHLTRMPLKHMELEEVKEMQEVLLVEDQELPHNHKPIPDHKLVPDKQSTVDTLEDHHNNNKSQTTKEVPTVICHQ